MPSSMWLGRNSTQSQPVVVKPARMSESKVPRQIEVLSARTGVLGAGATVVRTAEDALRDAPLRPSFDGKATLPNKPLDSLYHKNTGSEETLIQIGTVKKEDYISPPCTPPLSPVREAIEPAVDRPQRPSRALPPLPPTPEPQYRAPDGSIALPELSQKFMAPPPRPAFEPLLVSKAANSVDAANILVVLETTTVTYKATFRTLTSRDSLLSYYLKGLFSKAQLATEDATPRPRSVASVYSTESAEDEDRAAYQRHLVTRGLVPSCSAVHIFLDRPSAPYAHILNYLRSATCTAASDEILPRSVQLQSASYTRLESLLELRDEAAYLELHGLHRLCTEELRSRQAPRLTARSSHSSSIRSQQAMVNLLQTVQDDMHSSEHASISSRTTRNDTLAGQVAESGSSQRPPTPQSYQSHNRGRSVSRHPPPSTQPPPGAGWF